jgi:F-type H+-transporting ATPase subunit epsilon
VRLTVWLPTQILLQQEVSRIKAEAVNGWFELLPHHVDFVGVLVPSVMSFTPVGQSEQYVATDEGVLVKCGPEVSVSTRAAVHDVDLQRLKEHVLAKFRAEEEKERENIAAEAKLEADLVRGLLELEKHA